MKQTLAIIFILILCFCTTQAQNVTYDLEDGIATLEAKHAEAWANIETVEGFRIQLTAVSGTNSKNAIHQAQQEFQAQFPDLPAYISFAEPYFRLRIGDFKNRLEATEALERIHANYPGAFIIKDEIKFK